MKRKIKKIFFEVISNTKILYIILFNGVTNNQNFVKLIRGIDKGGGTGQRRIRYLFLLSFKGNSINKKKIELLLFILKKLICVVLERNKEIGILST